LLADLRDESGDSEVFTKALEAIRSEAKKTDLLWLRTLLTDESPLVREAVASPIAELEGLSALRDLPTAFQRGLDEGYDHDGFAGLLIDMVSGDTGEAQRHLQALAGDADAAVRRNAEWLLEHCEANRAPQS